MATLLQYMKASKRRKTGGQAKASSSEKITSNSCLTLSFQESDATNTELHDTPLPLGDFAGFPAEVLYHILYVSPLTVLGTMSQTSRIMRDYILEFMDTKISISRITPDAHLLNEAESRWPRESRRFREALRKHYRDLASLMKKATCLFPTNERLRRVGAILNKLRESHVVICNAHGSAHAYSCYGEFLHTFVAGWEDDEKTKAYIAIQGASLLEGRMNEVLHCDIKGDQREKFEWYIKIFCRQLFIDRAEAGEKTFWIHKIMGNFSALEQARLLYITFGPQAYDKELKEPYIDWRLFLEDSVPGIELKGLGSALKLLAEDSKGFWAMETVMKIVKNLIEFPAQWRLENVCKMLRMAGKKVCYRYMEGIQNNSELYVTLFHLWQVSESEERLPCWEGENDSWFLSLVQHICSRDPTEKGLKHMMEGLVSAFEENVVIDIIEHRYAPETDVEEMQDIVSCQMKPLTSLFKILFSKFLNTEAMVKNFTNC